ncbi:MAG TPA: hypothetical protein PLI77_02425 [Bacteroidales bacterium]|nr:hypothetical protein [Bacteroidales bacterium]
MDWSSKGAHLRCENSDFTVESSPYSLGCNVEGELIAINTI